MPSLRNRAQSQPDNNNSSRSASNRASTQPQQRKRNHVQTDQSEESSEEDNRNVTGNNNNRRTANSRKGNGRTSTASESNAQDSNSDDDSDDDDESRVRRLQQANKRKSVADRQLLKQKAKAAFTTPGKNGCCISKKEMINNVLVYLMSRQNRLAPFTKAELIKDAMNGQARAFDYVIKIILKILPEKFLMKLVGNEKAKTKTEGFASYVLVSLVPTKVIHGPEDLPKSDSIKGFLGLLLTFIFMGESPIYDEVIWATITKMQLEPYTCAKEGDLRKFLKTEYVSKQYLTVEEEVSMDGVVEKCKYDWGIRAEYEFNKLEMLKRVAKNCGNGDITKYRTYPAAIKQMEVQGMVLNRFRHSEGISDVESDRGTDLDDEDLDVVTSQNVRKKNVPIRQAPSPRRSSPRRSSPQASSLQREVRSSRSSKNKKKQQIMPSQEEADADTQPNESSEAHTEDSDDDFLIGQPNINISQEEADAHTQEMFDSD